MKNIDNSECLVGYGRFIRAKRENIGLSQGEVAEELGISTNYYSLIERGRRNVDLVMAMRICSVLKLNLSDFIGSQM